MIAYGQALANIKALRAKAASPESIDALSVLDTAGTIGATSAQRKTEAETAAVKAPQPKITLDLVSGTIDATGVPLTSQVDQVKQAEAAPYLQQIESLKSALKAPGAPAGAQPADPTEEVDRSLSEYIRGLPKPNAPDIEANLATKEGRRKLIHDMGLDEEAAAAPGGMMGWARASDALDRLMADPDRLRRIVNANRANNLSEALKQRGAALRDMASVKTQERATAAAERQEVSSEAQLVDHLTNRNPLGYKSAEEHQKAIEGVLQRPMNDAELASLHAGRAEALHDREIEKTKQDLAEAKDKRDQVRIDQSEERLRALESKRDEKQLSPEEADWYIAQQDRGVKLEHVSAETALQIDKRRAAKGMNAPIALMPAAQSELGKLEGVKAQTRSLLEALEPYKNDNEPFRNLPQSVLYQLGIKSADDIGALQSSYQIENFQASMRLIPGIRRGDILEKVQKHTPNFTKDSRALAYEKLKNIIANIEGMEASIKQYGAKSGVVQTPAQGGGGLDAGAIMKRIEENRKKGKK